MKRITKITAFIIATVMVFSLLSVSVFAENGISGVFEDVPADAYYFEPVMWAYENGITTGTTATKFAPSSTCTRGQVVTFIWRAMGKPGAENENNPFKDIKDSDYYYTAVLWAVEKGITNGTGDETFSPERTCSVAHIVTFIYRAFGEPGKTGEGEWYADAINWAGASGLISGTRSAEADISNLNFTDCPRSDVVTILYRYSGNGDPRKVTADEVRIKLSEVNNRKRELLPGIVCWGDSLTAGAGGNGTSYPSTLEALINEKILQKFDFKSFMNASDESEVDWAVYNVATVPVINMGIGGERSDTIAGRADAIPLTVKSFTIPEEKTPVEISFIAAEGQYIAPLLQGDKGFNPVTIGGVKGKISVNTVSDYEFYYYFTRTTVGDETVVDDGTPVITASSGKYRDFYQVIMMGGNGGFNSLEELFEQYDAVIERQEKNGEKYIIVGYHGRLGALAQYDDIDAVMAERYGDRYISSITYLTSEKAFIDAGIEPTEQDLADIRNGVCPSSFLVDGVHFTASGYRLIGNLIFDRMESLGYFDELKEYLKID